MSPIVATKRQEIAELCRRFHVRRLDVFGSAARGTDFTDTSDIDFLVEYEPEHAPPAFADFLALQDSLSALLGREVDLVMEGAVRNPYVRASIDRARVNLHGT